MSNNQVVREYWEQEPCGTNPGITGDREPMTREWFEQVEEYRYRMEPFIHSVAQFTRHHGKRILEVGVGAGTDHLQWARAGAQCHGVDLTDAAIQTTRARLAEYGFRSELQRVDAEALPFPDASFDVVYSWGVIHHSENPDRIVAEIRRVLRPGGVFIGMMYGRRSVNAFRLWVRYALLRGRPWHTFRHVIWHRMESLGTKAYSRRELRQLFAEFTEVAVTPIITPYDAYMWPGWVARWFPNELGWFMGIHAAR
jgi:ubiquinone/menaquinone biosynthesis C-methylase UbiE